jgi:hypothetical protein
MTRDFEALAGANRYRYRYRHRKGQEENGKAKAALDRIVAMPPPLSLAVTVALVPPEEGF